MKTDAARKADLEKVWAQAAHLVAKNPKAKTVRELSRADAEGLLDLNITRAALGLPSFTAADFTVAASNPPTATRQVITRSSR